MNNTQDNGQTDTLSLMFEAARSFLGGAKIIMDSDGINDHQPGMIPTLPVTTCLALAIEIQLKALLEAHGVPRPKGDGHDLLSLFNTLPKEVRADVLAFQAQYTELSADSALQLLATEKNTFKTWRYPYEKAELETQPAPLYHLALALSEYLRSRFDIERSSNGWLRQS